MAIYGYHRTSTTEQHLDRGIKEIEVPYRKRAKLIFASNFPINLIEPDDAFWNRLIYLPFTKSIPKAKQDRELLSDFQFLTTSQIERKMQEWQGRNCATIENFMTDCCICSEKN